MRAEKVESEVSSDWSSPMSLWKRTKTGRRVAASAASAPRDATRADGGSLGVYSESGRFAGAPWGTPRAAGLSSSSALLVAAALGFLGLGPPPPSPEWGRMIAESREFLPEARIIQFPSQLVQLSPIRPNAASGGHVSGEGCGSEFHWPTQERPRIKLSSKAAGYG